MAYRRLNLRFHNYTDVADEVLKAIDGDGKFAVYVADNGTTNVCRLRNEWHNPRPESELVGVFTNTAPINVIEDALLARKRELSSQRVA